MKIGGFGNFQFLVLITFAIIRNLGLYTVYLFGMSTHAVQFECRENPDEEKAGRWFCVSSLENDAQVEGAVG